MGMVICTHEDALVIHNELIKCPLCKNKSAIQKIHAASLDALNLDALKSAEDKSIS